uniref:FHF complex subunit HOOK interacting protein 2 n=1 Tax=Hucho hucho TaxID=62062 RepID=A0A4W5K9E6_9TELE
MFSKFTSILQHAVEALAPSLPLQEDFVYHWKAITHYYIETSDDKAPVTDTNIPSHLEQMLDILTQEEYERESGETGPCMEYLLHHKILETLYTLGKADVRGTMPFSHDHVNSNHTVLAWIFFFHIVLFSNFSGCVTRPAQYSNTWLSSVKILKYLTVFYWVVSLYQTM